MEEEEYCIQVDEKRQKAKTKKDETYGSYSLLHSDLWFTADAQRKMTLKGNETMSKWIYMQSDGEHRSGMDVEWGLR